MNDKLATVVDYGVGNLFSIGRAVETCGGRVTITGDPDEIRKASRIILPGVGAFGDGMAGLDSNCLSEAIKESARAGTPLIGICLGMQMLLDTSDEFGSHAGLGLISGAVKPLPETSEGGARHKIPNIGWQALREHATGRWRDSILDGSAPDAEMYFVHSFAAEPLDEADMLATYDFSGHTICAALERDNIAGCQFHPERSGPAGLAVIARFLDK
jgi:glutamine amidotransferase